MKNYYLLQAKSLKLKAWGMERKEGFSIMEILVVLIIVGILAALAIPGFQRAVEEAKFKEAKSVLKSIRGAEKLFKASNGNYVGVDRDPTTYPQGNCPNDDPPLGDGDGVCDNKDVAWDLLNIEVIETADAEWTYGASWGCGCSPGGGAGDDADNVAIIPFARREAGAEAGRYMYIRMSDGEIRGNSGADPRPGQLFINPVQICADIGGNCDLQR